MTERENNKGRIRGLEEESSEGEKKTTKAVIKCRKDTQQNLCFCH